MAKGFEEFEGFDPRTGEQATIRLIRAELDRIARYAPEQHLYDLYCAQAVARVPQVAFLGLRTIDDQFGDRREYSEEPDDSGVCMCGVPSQRVLEKARRNGAPPGHTLCVFLDSRLTITGWDWVKADADHPEWPVNWERRFAKLIWQKS